MRAFVLGMRSCSRIEKPLLQGIYIRFCLISTVLTVIFASPCSGQSAPQFQRDYIYGPKGVLVATIEPDVYPPTFPSSIYAQQAGQCPSDGIAVNFGSSTDVGSGVSFYVVYRSDGAEVYSGGANGSFTDTNIQADTPYSYTVYAQDHAGNLSDGNSSGSVDVPDCIFDDEFVARKTLPRSADGHANIRFSVARFFRDAAVQAPSIVRAMGSRRDLLNWRGLDRWSKATAHADVRSALVRRRAATGSSLPEGPIQPHGSKAGIAEGQR